MTVVTGLVDAFSYLVLGHVFVANMTGNVLTLTITGITADSKLAGRPPRSSRPRRSRPAGRGGRVPSPGPAGS